MKRVLFLALLLGVASVSRSSAQSADEAAIRKMAASYVEAFNKHDAEHWSPDAVYLNRTTGEESLDALPSPTNSRRFFRISRNSSWR